jgi:hypothetical protein
MIQTIIGVLIGGVVSLGVAIFVENMRRPKLTLSIETPPLDQPHQRALRVKLFNEPLPSWAKWIVRAPALQCRAEITFHHRDGHDVFGRIMEGRWASSPEPVPSPILDLDGMQKFNLVDFTRITLGSRVDVYPGEGELLDIVNRPHEDDNCYGWNNETYFSTPRWQNPKWRLVPERYLVSVVIRSSGQNCFDCFRLVNDVSQADFRLEPTNRNEKALVRAK